MIARTQQPARSDPVLYVIGGPGGPATILTQRLTISPFTVRHALRHPDSRQGEGTSVFMTMRQFGFVQFFNASLVASSAVRRALLQPTWPSEETAKAFSDRAAK